MITLARPFLSPPFYPGAVSRLTNFHSVRPSGRDRFPAAFSTPIGPEESMPTRIGVAGVETAGGRVRRAGAVVAG